jgi:hypothetical protein
MQNSLKLGDYVRRIDGKCENGMVVDIFDKYSGCKPTADDSPDDTRIAVRIAWPKDPMPEDPMPEDPMDDEWTHQEPAYWELIADDRKKI